MEFEDRIREKRTAEAVQKNLLGQEGKIFLISKLLGEPIVKESSGPEILDFDNLDADFDNTIPLYDDETTSVIVGHFYEGLKHGHHLEIIYNEFESTLKLYYKGFLCYHEENNVLLSYVPNEGWENIVENLYKVVEQKIKYLIEKRKMAEKEAFSTIKQHEIKRLTDKWGNIF